jgi:hypothetical protein
MLSASRKIIWKELQIKNIIIKTCTAIKYAYRNFSTLHALFKYDTSETLVKCLKNIRRICNHFYASISKTFFLHMAITNHVNKV